MKESRGADALGHGGSRPVGPAGLLCRREAAGVFNLGLIIVDCHSSLLSFQGEMLFISHPTCLFFYPFLHYLFIMFY